MHTRKRDINDYLRMIRSIAYKFSKSTGIDVEELYSEACFAFTRASKKYDASRGKMSTLLYTSVKYHLFNYIRHQKPQHEELPETIADTRLPSDRIAFITSLNILGPKPRALCHMIFNTPDVYDGMKKSELHQYLYASGWTHSDISNSIREIRQVLHVE